MATHAFRNVSSRRHVGMHEGTGARRRLEFERLVDELGITPSEFESVFKLIVSRLELTLERYTS